MNCCCRYHKLELCHTSKWQPTFLVPLSFLCILAMTREYLLCAYFYRLLSNKQHITWSSYFSLNKSVSLATIRIQPHKIHVSRITLPLTCVDVLYENVDNAFLLGYCAASLDVRFVTERNIAQKRSFQLH